MSQFGGYTIPGGIPGSTTIAGPPITGFWPFGALWFDSNNALWLCIAAGTPGTWVQQPGSAAYGLTTNRWMISGPGNTGATFVLNSNVGYFSPLLVTKSITVKAIGVDITSGGSAGALVRLGIYNDTGSGSPGTVLLDAGTTAATGTGAVSIGISITLTPGLYWLVAAGQGAPATQPTLEALFGGNPYVAVTSLTDGGNIGGYQVAGISGALPGTPSVSDANPVAMIGVQGA